MAQVRKQTKSGTSTKTVKLSKAEKAEIARTVAAQGTERLKGHVGGFFEFIRSQGVVGLAVGLAIGVAATDTVKRIVEGFINPIVQFLVGSQDKLSQATWTFEAFGRSAEFAWGAALSSAITLLATALVIYWLVHIFQFDKLDKKKS